MPLRARQALGIFSGSALLGRYRDDPLALRLFGLILIAKSATRTAIWAYAVQKPSLVHELLERASIRVSGQSPAGDIEGPAADLVADKTAFGSECSRRWFGETWPAA